MIFTDDQFQKIEHNIKEINQIMVNNSTSGVSIRLHELINTLAKDFNWESCKTCNHVLYNQIATIYSFYLQDKKERDKVVVEKSDTTSLGQISDVQNNLKARRRKIK